MCDETGTLMDISGGDGNTDVTLTLDNGSVTLFPPSGSGNNMTTVRVLGGYYITNVYTSAVWDTTHAEPQLYCEVAQR